MQGPSLKVLLFHAVHPLIAPGTGNPGQFDTFIRNRIVPEIREETQRFYGPHQSNSLEYRYPGLDYTDKGHRLRLSQFPNHRILFRAFEKLGLAKYEIDGLCTWEGTKAAREGYQRLHNVVIRDTTFDGIPDSGPQRLPSVTQNVFPYITSQPSGRGGYLPSPRVAHNSSYYSSHSSRGSSSPFSSESEQESSDDLVSHGIGMSLNRRLFAPSERQYRGNASTNIDPAWEAWMKDAAERGTIPSVSALGGSDSRLAAYQAHIPAHWPYATPGYHYGPHSPAPPTFSPTYVYTYSQQPVAPAPAPQPIRSYQFNSFAARQTRRHLGRSSMR